MIRRTTRKLAILSLASGIATLTIGSAAMPAHAAPPTHVMNIVKDITATIPPLAECPAGNVASIDLVFQDSFHLIFTDTTFHVTDTETGTFTGRSADGDVLTTGHFTTTSAHQGTGFPAETLTSNINATGKAIDGSLVRVQIAQHFTITPDGDVTASFTRVNCS